MAKEKGEMTVEEAGHLGGMKGGKKGGETTSKRYGHEFYEDIGHKGGQKVKRLVEEGERMEEK
jgi:general stress protein YciG